MKKTFGKVLAGAIIGSFLMVGSALALPFNYFSTTDFTTGTNGDINLYASGDTVFGIYWVDDITGTPPVVNQSLDVNFDSSSFVKTGQLDWTINGTAWNVKNAIAPGAGVTNVPDLFGFYFQKNGIRYYTDPALSTDPVMVTTMTDTSYIFTHGEDSASVIVDDITATANAPVPEPATMLLFGAGLVGIVGAVRRKARK